MKDLWTELARKVRESGPEPAPEMPFGFDEAVLRRLATAGRDLASPLELFGSLLRPALGLAVGTAMLCLLLQVRVQNESKTQTNLIAETAVLLESALLNE